MYRENILDQVLSRENLNQAYKKVKSNKGAAGVDGMKVKELGLHLVKHKEIIIKQIRTRTYQPQPVKRVSIPKPNGGTRALGIPTVTDRVIQQSIAQVLSPIFDRDFNDNSYGFRPNRYAEQAIVKSLEMMNSGYSWVVDIDLEKFFDTVNHDRLMNLVSRTIKDGDVISLIRKFLVSGMELDGNYETTSVGTPQGGPLSPLLSNIMLNELDKELEKRQLNFVRYADDCIILVKSEKAANRVMASVTTYIEKKLGLKVNATKSKVTRPERGLKFLGFGFYWDSSMKEFKSKPHKQSIIVLKDKLKYLTSRRWGVSTAYRIEKINQLIRGWINYYKRGQMRKVCHEIDGHLRFRMRMCIWKQWKKTRTKFTNLMKLGIEKQKAWEWANTRKGYARVASSFILHRAITNKRLEKFGLLSLTKQYELKHS
jgi:group II intron reverse transcriptase/maturase